ncbi:flagellar filament capping protein FliD [Planctobacterium marinum]|uniref:Flagellar hook-associated protein 2 n=1 Tax=Planctobacterium marinum TaxID=1631968 RepID=A0AA48HTP9_9ALTE|nr:flagellar hook-associated protein 2 [Planctobacterium marinum]
MGIQSLGVGSGLALDDLVTQLIDAERAPKEERLNEREETLDATISAIGSLKSKVDEFQDAVEELKNDYNLNAREPTIDHPTEPEEGETGPFTVEASSSAIEGDYDIAIAQLAAGTEYRTADGSFSTTSDTLYTGAGTSVSFNFESSSDNFSVSVTTNMTLQQYVDAINGSADNIQDDGTTKLVNAILLDTGTADGPKIIFESLLTGNGNDLRIVNEDGDAELSSVTSHTNDGVGGYNADQELSTNTGDEAKVTAVNAQAYVNNVLVESGSNQFENAIANVSFEAFKVSETDASTATGFAASKVTIGNDTEGVKTKIQDFIDNYNSLVDEITRLTKYGESELEDDGALAGDFMIRSIQSGILNALTSTVTDNSFGSIFNIGLSFDDDGKLEISAVDEFGIGSGSDRLDDALQDNFDDVADLFTNSTNGVAQTLYDFLYEYTTFGGLLRDRESDLADEKDALADEREAFELRMLSFEQIQRDKFIALDKTVSSLNNTGNALFAALGGL